MPAPSPPPSRTGAGPFTNGPLLGDGQHRDYNYYVSYKKQKEKIANNFSILYTPQSSTTNFDSRAISASILNVAAPNNKGSGLHCTATVHAHAIRTCYIQLAPAPRGRAANSTETDNTCERTVVGEGTRLLKALGAGAVWGGECVASGQRGPTFNGSPGPSSRSTSPCPRPGSLRWSPTSPRRGVPLHAPSPNNDDFADFFFPRRHLSNGARWQGPSAPP